MAQSSLKTEYSSPEQLKSSLCKKIVEFQKREQLEDEELAMILKITSTQAKNILSFNTDKISLSTLYELQSKIPA